MLLWATIPGTRRDKLAEKQNMVAPDALARAILRVGDGRGFVVERRRRVNLDVERIIITAAHCLPRLQPPYEHLLRLPRPHPGRDLNEGTYQRLLGPLGGELTMWAECLFVDPVADIAVLGQPDNQALSEQADAYDELVADMTALAVADAPPQGTEVIEGEAITIGGVRYDIGPIERPTAGKGPARVLSLDGNWCEGRVERRSGWLKFEPHAAVVEGMSGSPIINTAGAAIGVISVESMSPVIVDSLSTQIVRAISLFCIAGGATLRSTSDDGPHR
jgi:Trypsin-like peptidase domain